MRRVFVAFAIFAVLFSSGLMVARHKAAAARVQAQRDAFYQSQLARVQHDLRLGAPRSKVQQYLGSQKLQYGQSAWDILMHIGTDPAHEWFCDRWEVYLQLRFSHLPAQADPSPFDNLDTISIQKIGHCL